MRYWWVNQNQTYQHEVPGNYLWSPKRKSDGHANAFYDFMREVAPGDVVFSFKDTYIKAIGRVASYGYESPKPLEFGTAGAYWEKIGWRVDVIFVELRGPIKPSSHMEVLGPLLPEKYSPLRPTGHGLQSVYLTLLPAEMAGALIDLIGREAHHLLGEHVLTGSSTIAALGLAEWEEYELERVRSDDAIPDTERRAIILARRGQGVFKANVLSIEKACRITGVNRVEHLRASHCRPWRDSSNQQRLDAENGLLLTPSIDHLFDRGFIGFESNGSLIVSPVAHSSSLERMGIETTKVVNVGRFTEGQEQYLQYHRENVLLRSKFLEGAG